MRIRILPLTIILVLLFACLPVRDVHAAGGIVHMLDNPDCDEDIATIDLSYDNNKYICVQDVAHYLADTEKHFGIHIDSEGIHLNTQDRLSDIDKADKTDSSDEIKTWRIKGSIAFNDLYLDEEKHSYPSVIADYDDNGNKECFMTPYDLGMLLDIDIDIDDNRIIINPDKPFNVDPYELEKDNYFEGINAAIVGNASTGEIYYSYKADTPYAIASTTKLMSYLVIVEKLANDGISEQDEVTLSYNAQTLSESDDGLIKMTEGMKVPVSELVYGMLLPSSNEAALALAEYTYGTETAFVEAMNKQARALDMNSAIFYNCNGLPKYSEESIPAKLSNKASASDMFKLCSYILSTHPEIKDVTSVRKIKLDALGTEVKNTNPLLYNLKECTGLKTGTTNKAGACLVTSLAVDTSYGTDDLLVIELGAENSFERCRVSEMLSRYAIDVRTGRASLVDNPGENQLMDIPTTAEGFVSYITHMARLRSLAYN